MRRSEYICIDYFIVEGMYRADFSGRSFSTMAAMLRELSNGLSQIASGQSKHISYSIFNLYFGLMRGLGCELVEIWNQHSSSMLPKDWMHLSEMLHSLRQICKYYKYLCIIAQKTCSTSLIQCINLRWFHHKDCLCTRHWKTHSPRTQT